jgi:hypothetical protein
MEEKLAARLRNGSGGQSSARPWTPWENVRKDSVHESGSSAKSVGNMQRRRSSKSPAGSQITGKSTRSRHSEAEADVWGGDISDKTRVAASDADKDLPVRDKGVSAPATAQQQKQEKKSNSRMDFMSLVMDGALDGSSSTGQTRPGGGADKCAGGGYGGYGRGGGGRGSPRGAGLLGGLQ